MRKVELVGTVTSGCGRRRYSRRRRYGRRDVIAVAGWQCGKGEGRRDWQLQITAFDAAEEWICRLEGVPKASRSTPDQDAFLDLSMLLSYRQARLPYRLSGALHCQPWTGQYCPSRASRTYLPSSLSVQYTHSVAKCQWLFPPLCPLRCCFLPFSAPASCQICSSYFLIGRSLNALSLLPRAAHNCRANGTWGISGKRGGTLLIWRSRL